MTGKFTPQPIEVIVRNIRPRGEIRERRVPGMVGMIQLEFQIQAWMASQEHSYREIDATEIANASYRADRSSGLPSDSFQLKNAIRRPSWCDGACVLNRSQLTM